MEKDLTKREYVFWGGEPREVEDYEEMGKNPNEKINYAYLRPSPGCPSRSCVPVDKLYYLSQDEKLLLVPESELSTEELMKAIQVASKTRAAVSDKPAAKAKRKKAEPKAGKKLKMDSEAVALLGLDLLN